jgi:hypothetical protein
MRRKAGTNSSNVTGVYLDIFHEIATSGTIFKDNKKADLRRAIARDNSKSSMEVKLSAYFKLWMFSLVPTSSSLYYRM